MKYLHRHSRLTPHCQKAERRIVARFLTWCKRHRHAPRNLENILTWLREMHDLSRGATQVWLVAVRRYILDTTGKDPLTEADRPLVRHLLNHRKEPHHRSFNSAEITCILDSFERGGFEVRDKALLLLMYTGRLGVRAICELNLRDVQILPRGMIVRTQARRCTIARYTDARYCPVRAMEQWLRIHPGTCEALFVSFSRRVKRIPYATVEAAIAKRLRIAGVALHSGIIALHGALIVLASRRGASSSRVMKQSGILKIETIKRWLDREHPDNDA